MAEKTVVDAAKRRLFPDIIELFRNKDLLIILAYRDLRVRYAQTVLGLAWTLLEPLATLLVVTLIFKKAMNVDTGDVPYTLFSFAGISSWTYFATTMKESGRSMIGAGDMIKKIYFPRLAVPLSKAVVGLVDYSVTLLLLAIMMAWHGYIPGKYIFLMPVFMLAILISSVTVGIWISALTIRYRDLQHIVPFIVQFGLFASPVAYPSELVIPRMGDQLAFLYYLNPMAGLIDAIRWCLFETAPPNAYAAVSLIVVVVLLVGGLLYFKRIERVMADIV